MALVRAQYRIKKVLSDWLGERAKQNNRSKNGELNAILQSEMDKTKKAASHE